MSDHAHKPKSDQPLHGQPEHDPDEEIVLRPEKARQGLARPNTLMVLVTSLVLAALVGLGIFLIYW